MFQSYSPLSTAVGVGTGEELADLAVQPVGIPPCLRRCSCLQISRNLCNSLALPEESGKIAFKRSENDSHVLKTLGNLNKNLSLGNTEIITSKKDCNTGNSHPLSPYFLS